MDKSTLCWFVHRVDGNLYWHSSITLHWNVQFHFWFLAWVCKYEWRAASMSEERRDHQLKASEGIGRCGRRNRALGDQSEGAAEPSWMPFIHSCRREVKKCQWFVDDVWSLQKMQELTANLEGTEREHGRTLIKLEEERKLKRDHLKAAQVRQANLRARSSWVKEQLRSQVYSAEPIEHGASRSYLSCHSLTRRDNPSL